MEANAGENKIKISVITPTVRPEGLALLEKSLRQQTFRDFEWIVGSPKPPKLAIDYKWVKDPPKNEGDYWTLYKCYNAMIKECTGDFIISWQDYTYVKPDTLERMWLHHLTNPKSLIGVVGDKYSDDTWTNKTWKDPRDRGYGFVACPFHEVEWNFCGVPKEALYSVGGFDEDLDKYSSLCGADVAVRIEIMKQFDFKMDQDIKTYSTEHGRLPEWDEHSPFGKVWLSKLEEYKENPKLNYL